MHLLRIIETVTIERPADLVRAQFGDVAHHQDTDVHAAVAFELVDDDGRTCRYMQVSRAGILRVRQHVTLTREPDGLLVNRITRGPLRDGTITFRVEATGHSRCIVTATVAAELRGLQALLSPLLRRRIAQDLRAALDEDKADLERGGYRPARHARQRPAPTATPIAAP